LGLIGCGGFGLFCLEAFAAVEGLRLVALADAHKAAADQAGRRHPGAAVHYSAAELVARDDVDIVHIATPPSSHHGLAMMAARAGKHVLCEKPLAMDLAQADEMLAAARRHKVIMPVDFVIRHNPVTDAVKAIVDSGLLGRPLHAAFENYASDENLGPAHWFWDKTLSGGIFIEHGVHFFDLYRHWLGPGRVISAHAEIREGTAQEDRVMCTVRHDSGAVAHHYHGFDQAGYMDRTDHRLVFELGDLTVTGWIPVGLSVHALVNDSDADVLAALCASLRVEIRTLETYQRDSQRCRSRGRQRHVAQKVRITADVDLPKQDVYAASVRRLMTDQLLAIADPQHARRITEDNGRQSLALAVAAARLAGDARHWTRPSP
jgi:predicted dehydrogenase